MEDWRLKMSSRREFKSFDEFWPFYLGEHRKPLTRWMHFAGMTMVLTVLAYAVDFHAWKILILIPIVGYAPAWIGHFLVEKNRPATFLYPIRSLVCDFMLFSFMITGRIDSELSKYGLK